MPDDQKEGWDDVDVLQPGQKVGEYRIVRFLGRGGFGITYRAEDTERGHTVAIKEYYPIDFSARGRDGVTVQSRGGQREQFEKFRTRFLEEGAILKGFCHPAIVRVDRSFEANGTAYLVMDFENGLTLKDYLKALGRRPTEDELYRLLSPLLDALEVVHGANLLHRDISPRNIILRPDGVPVLIDFGSARFVIPGETRTLTAIATPGYTPIEQYLGEKQGHGTDIYALGAVLYEAVTGITLTNAVTRDRSGTYQRASKDAEGRYSIGFLEAIDWAVELHLKDRPQTVAAWREKLVPVSPKVQVLEGRFPKPASVFRDVRADGTECPDFPEMVVIPKGRFLMGSPANEPGRFDDEGPQHPVTIGADFAIGRYPVTFAEWDAWRADGGGHGYRPSDNRWGRGRRPVINVTWHDAQAYVRWLSQKTGQPYRLPSEAEWEYAARAGTTTPFWWGDTITPDQANYNGNYAYNGGAKGVYRGQTVEVGGFPANPFGLYDMAGNVWQWVEDSWHASYEGAPDDGGAWTTKDSNTSRVLRGGSWDFKPNGARSASRIRFAPDDRYLSNGFRIARTLPLSS